MSTHQLAFINDNVNNWEALAANLPNDVTVVHLDSQRDGLHQIVDYLHDQSIQNLAAIHLLSHGASGQVQLGNLTLTQDNLATQHDLLSQLGQALTPDGDLLLYGCNVAQGQTGLDFIGQLAQITQADVAASNNLTGKNGNWVLEKSTGQIDTTDNWERLLSQYDNDLAITHTFDSGMTNTGSNTATITVKNTTSNVSIKMVAAHGVWRIGNDTANGYATTYFGNWAINEAGVASTVAITVDLNNDGTFGDPFSLNSFKLSDPSFNGGTYTIKPNGLTAGQETILLSTMVDSYSTFTPTTVTNFNNITGFTVQFDSSATGITLDDFDVGPSTVVNTAPTITSGASGSVAENAATSTVVYTTTVTDPESDAITYALTGTDAAAFDISATGTVTLKASADYETKPSYSIIVNASDAAHTASPTTKNVTISVTNVNEKPVITAPASQSVNQGVATALTGISVVDPDSGANPITVSLSAPAGTFTSTTGNGVTVAGSGTSSMTLTGTQTNINNFITTSKVTYTTAAGATGTVTLSIGSNDGGNSGSGGTQTDSKTETLNIAVTNAAPTAVNFTSAGLSTITALAGATAGTLSAVDPNAGDTHTFTLVAGNGTNDADNNKFTLTSAGVLKVGTTPLNIVTGTYHVMTRATDAGGLSFDQAQTITIANPPPPPTPNPSPIIPLLPPGPTPTPTPTPIPAPTPAPVPTPAPQIIDGVALQTLTTSNGGQQITIPLVSADRSEDKTTANSHLADIPLAKNTAGTTILSLGIPTGVGAIVSGTSSSISLGEAKNELIRQIEAKTTQDSDSRSSMSTDGLQFLSALTSSDTLRVQTITPSVDKTTQTITTPIVITATPQIDGSKQAIVLDTQQLPSKTPITVNNIDFISVVGSARITGGAGANIAVGDNEDQFIVLGADDDELHGGGGTDTIGSLTGNDKLYGDGGNDVVYGGTGNDTLDGGSGNNVLNGGFGQDTALLAGTLADYQVTLINSNQIQLTHRTTSATNTLIDIETVTFTGNQETWQLTYTPGKTQIIQDHVANVSANRNIVTDLLTTQGDDHGYVSMGLALSIDAKAGFDVLNMTGSRSDINYRLLPLDFTEIVDFYNNHPTETMLPTGALEITRLTDGAMLDLKNVDFIAFDNGDAIAIAHNHTETVIGRLFHTLLNRDPSAHEWQLAQQASTAYQQGNLSADTILNWFTTQNPTLNQQNNSAYLQTLYQQTFGRDPSTVELTTALQTLDNASTSRDAIAVTIAASNEALSSINNLITAYQWL